MGLGVAVLLSTNAAAAQWVNQGVETARNKEKAQEPETTWEQEEEEQNEGRLRGTALAQELNGPEIADGPPPIAFMPALSVHVPYQLLALGATLELFPVPWLRFSALYSFGIAIRTDPVAWTSYAEALAGVRVFGTTGESAVDVPLKKRGAGINPVVPAVKAWVPSYRGLYVEAGGMTGYTSLALCPDPCDAVLPLVERQLVMPVAGLRYVYSYDVRSVKRNVRKRTLIEVYAHVLGKPFNAPAAGPLYLPDNTEAGDAGIGGRVGVVVPPLGGCLTEITLGWDCFASSLAVGYAPYPRFFLIELQAGVYIY